MGVYGYLRVSTKEQNTDYQRSQILEYSNDNKLGSVTFIDDTVSGAVDWKN